MSTIRILHIDDDMDLLTLGRKILESMGDYEIVSAPSAKTALELLSQENFDAIISDYLMPDMDGIGLLKKIRGQGISLPLN